MTQKENPERIPEELLFKYFRSDTSPEEETALNAWLEEDSANRKRFRRMFDLYEALVLHGILPETTRVRPSVRNRRDRILRTAALAAANVAAAVAIVFGAAHIIRSSVQDQLSRTMAEVRVPAGQQMDFVLPDSTCVKLNAGASLRYPMAFSRKNRTVSLTGEAYFSVTHNPDKPFIVKTFASDIEVLGTEFGVDADPAAGTFSVALVKGSVKVGNGTEELLMKPDETVNLVGGHLRKAAQGVRKHILWTQGIIDIGGQNFEELMREFENAFGVRIVLERADVPALHCTGGEVRVNDGIDYALRVLQHLADFRYERDGDTFYIH